MKKVPVRQERYMEKLLQEYAKLINSPLSASERFLELEKRIRKDKRHPGVMTELDKSEALRDIAVMIRQNVIALQGLEGFSRELKDYISALPEG